MLINRVNIKFLFNLLTIAICQELIYIYIIAFLVGYDKQNEINVRKSKNMVKFYTLQILVPKNRLTL